MKQLQAPRARRISCACQLGTDFWTGLLRSCAQILSKLCFRNFILVLATLPSLQDRDKRCLLVLALQVTQLDCGRVEKATFTHS